MQTIQTHTHAWLKRSCYSAVSLLWYINKDYATSFSPDASCVKNYGYLYLSFWIFNTSKTSNLIFNIFWTSKPKIKPLPVRPTQSDHELSTANIWRGFDGKSDWSCAVFPADSGLKIKTSWPFSSRPQLWRPISLTPSRCQAPAVEGLKSTPLGQEPS